jgi:signal peptidase I
MNNLFSITSSETTGTISDQDAIVLVMGIFLLTLVSIAVLYVFSAICLGRILKKAGKESWPAWVPYYNNWVLFELGDQNGAYILFQFIPLIGLILYLIFLFIAMYNIGLKLGKSGAFILWGIFLSPVWFVWLAFDKSKWNNKATTTNPAIPN